MRRSRIKGGIIPPLKKLNYFIASLFGFLTNGNSDAIDKSISN